MEAKLTAQEGRPQRLFPDGNFIRREIPISEVAARLGLKRNARYLFCWREAHHGRATVGIHLKSNSLRCFKCDTRNLSPVDLVRDVRGISVGEAFHWFESEWPDIPKVRLKVTTNRCGYNARAWPEVSCDALALSPAWTRLSHAKKAIAAAVIARVPRERDIHPLLTFSYGELQKWAGIGDRHTVARGLAKLRAIGLFQTCLVLTGRETQHGFATRQTLLRLTWHSRRFQAWLAESSRDLQPRTTTATGYTVLKPTLCPGGGKSLEQWKPEKGARVQ